MPTYDYRCKACRHAFELFQSMTEPVKRTCPRCGRRALERLIGTGAALLFKGSGFYQTDYRSESYRKAAEAEKTGVDGSKAAGTSGTSGAGDSAGGSSESRAGAPVRKPARRRTRGGGSG
jgi:putative FmdB family regulatory protein